MQTHEAHFDHLACDVANLHSIANILSGTARRRRDELIAFIEESQHPDLLPELRKLQSGDTRSSWDNFLYFAARIYYAANGHDRPDRNREEEERGIITVEPDSALDVGIQIVELAKLNAADLDPRILKVSVFRRAYALSNGGSAKTTSLCTSA